MANTSATWRRKFEIKKKEDKTLLNRRKKKNKQRYRDNPHKMKFIANIGNFTPKKVKFKGQSKT